MPTLKGFLNEPFEYRGIPNVRNLFFQCPTTNPALKKHYDVIQVHEGPSTQVGNSHIWHYEIHKDDNICYVSPSIDASLSPCGFHDFYNFILVEWKEMEAYDEVLKG